MDTAEAPRIVYERVDQAPTATDPHESLPPLPPLQQAPAPASAPTPLAPAASTIPVPAAPEAPFAWRPRAGDEPPNGPAPPRDDAAAPLELGVGTFLMGGGAAGGYAGVAPFLVGDVGHAVFLRPSVSLGGSIATNVPSTWVAARLDTCARLPGRYATRGGLQLDLCGGADVGFSYLSSGIVAGTPATGQTLPFVDLGPSVDLRAEVGRLAVTLRAIGGFDVTREGFVDATGSPVDVQAWSWRLELDLSWVLRDDRTEPLAALEGIR